MKKGLRILCVVILTMSLSYTVSAQDSQILEPWSIDLENTVRLDYYDYSGDQAGSPYFKTRSQFYDELSGQFARDFSPYEFILGRFNLLYNDSAYRRNEKGLTLERAGLMWEKGDVAVPFRAELGDHYAFLSTRTMQRSLKGGRFEIQPLSESPGRGHSIVFFGGTEDDTYDHLRMEKDFYAGGSWLVEDMRLGSYSLNLVTNSRKSDRDLNLPSRDQTIVSMTGNRQLELGAQKVNLEGEISRFMGDHAATAATARKNVSGMGYFGQVRGETGTPLTYQLRLEDYDKDYVPAGGGVNPDHRSYNAQAGWRFQKGLNLRGRLQHYIDGVDSGNPLKTWVVGTTLTGPVDIGPLPRLSTNFDAFVQDAQNRDKSTKYLASVARLNLGMPVRTWAAQLFLGAKRHDDQRPSSDPSEYTYDLGLKAAHALVLGSWKGSITPGVTYQKREGNNTDQDSYGLNLALQLAAQGHQAGFDYRLFYQDYRTGGRDDHLTHGLGFNYRYSRGPHSIGVEADYEDRRPDPGKSTKAYRVGCFYNFRFGKPAGISLPAALRSVVRGTVPSSPSSETELLADPAYIGADVSTVMADLHEQGLSGGMAMPGMVVYEARLLEEIFQRQRFALLTMEEEVTGSVLAIEFDDVGDYRSMSQVFDEVVSAVVRRLGRPFDTYFKGDFNQNLVQDINRGAFVRILEWETQGGAVRLGIPQRLDRQVRIEMQYRESFPSHGDTYWSIESLQ